jgi:hypothetical protein
LGHVGKLGYSMPDTIVPCILFGNANKIFCWKKMRSPYLGQGKARTLENSKAAIKLFFRCVDLVELPLELEELGLHVFSRGTSPEGKRTEQGKEEEGAHSGGGLLAFVICRLVKTHHDTLTRSSFH